MSRNWPARMHSGGRRRSLAALFAGLAMLSATAASARELGRIDRLGDVPAQAAPAAPAGARAPDASLHRHSRLGVPTFFWPQQGGAAADLVAAHAAALPADPTAAARSWLRQLAPLYELPDGRADALPVRDAQRLPNGSTIVKFQNRINGVEVFREEAAVLLDPDRRLLAIDGFLMGGAGAAPFQTGPEAAVAAALLDWSFGADAGSRLEPIETRGDYRYFDLPEGTLSADGSWLDAPVRVKPVWFRVPDQLLPAYYIEVQVRDGAERGVLDNYAYVVAAGDHSVLFRHNQTADAAFAYRVFAESSRAPVRSSGRAHST